MVFDEAEGRVVRLGALLDETTMAEGIERENRVLTNLPLATIQWEAGPPDASVIATEFLGDGRRADRGILRLSEGGRFMNRLDIPYVRYARR